MVNFKQQAAQKAATFISNNMIVGLGAGSTIAFLIDAIEPFILDGMIVQFVTSSFSTLQLLQSKKLPTLTTASLGEIDLYFDGCDQMDKNLNALKSGGGIHTHEKLLASMAKQFVLIGDESKWVDRFDIKYPLVVEILPQAIRFAPKKFNQLFEEANLLMRMNDKKDGPVITENGNYLIDIYFSQWPAISSINQLLKNITGIVETSLFVGLANKAVIAGEQGCMVVNR